MRVKRKSDADHRWILYAVIFLIVILICAEIMRNTDHQSEKETSSGYPPESWTWTPVPDEQLAEIVQKDPEAKPADLSVYGIDNNRVIAMSQRACVEYLSEDNDFNGVIMIADPKNSVCQKVMQTYVTVAEEESDVKFYYVDLRAGKYKEAIRSVLASTLPKDKTGKPVMKTPLVLAVHGDQVVDYLEGTVKNSSDKALMKRYRKMAKESLRHG